MSGKTFQTPRGTVDHLPDDIYRWQHIQKLFQGLVEKWGYREIRTPIFEDRDLFVRSSGDTSEVVTKQMYEFRDKSDRELALRPEGTAPVMRAVIQHNLVQPGQNMRLWYFVSNFRYERPGPGRLRQHHQLGLEFIGSPSPGADAEVIELTIRFYEALGMKGMRVLLNSIGRQETRARFREVLISHIRPWLAEQAEEDRAKAEKNPLRLFDSKDEAVQAMMADAPLILDYLEESSARDFDRLQGMLAEAGVDFVVDPRCVRGLDYYTDTVFEAQAIELGTHSSVCGGGRYDGLIPQLGGADIPSVGVGIGVERALRLCEAQQVAFPEPPRPVFIVAIGDAAKQEAASLAHQLRDHGIVVMQDVDGKGPKQQFKQADRAGARTVIVLGEDELAQGVATLKDMQTASQRQVPRADILSALR